MLKAAAATTPVKSAVFSCAFFMIVSLFSSIPAFHNYFEQGGFAFGFKWLVT
jgi:hypothetical protein